MPSTDATAFPVRGQAFRFTGCIRSLLTSNPITGGLTSIVTQVSKDGGAFASATTNATEIGTSGYFSVDLSAAEMTAQLIVVRVAVGNANAIEFSTEIRPVDLRENDGLWLSQSPVKMEQVFVQLSAFYFNLHTLQLNLERIYKRDNTSVLLQGAVSQANETSTVTRSPLS